MLNLRSSPWSEISAARLETCLMVLCDMEIAPNVS